MSKEELWEAFRTFIFSLSFYSPLAVVAAVVYWGFTLNAPVKSFIYFILIGVISVVRYALYANGPRSSRTSVDISPDTIHDQLGGTISELCSKFLIIPHDATYSICILSFTFWYLFIPMIMLSTSAKINAYNFGVIGFFGAYLIFDIMIKTSLNCISIKNAIFNFIIGAGIGIACGMFFYTTARSFIFINESQSNKEICSMPTKQQFKCKLYKNGELVSN